MLLATPLVKSHLAQGVLQHVGIVVTSAEEEIGMSVLTEETRKQLSDCNMTLVQGTRKEHCSE